MGRISSFLMGFVCGAVALYVGMSFHIVRADDGFHFVAKSNLNFSDSYVDIREFTVSDWREHVGLAQDIAKAEKTELLKDAAQISLQNTMDDLFDRRRR